MVYYCGYYLLRNYCKQSNLLKVLSALLFHLFFKIKQHEVSISSISYRGKEKLRAFKKLNVVSGKFKIAA